MMFMQPPNGSAGVRPFMVAFILLLLFLSMQAEWSPPQKRTSDWETVGQPAAVPARRSVKDTIVYELSVSNEKLESENMALRQHVLDLRRAARAAGCNLPAANVTFFPLPGLEDTLSGAGPASAPAAGSSAEAADKGEGQGSQDSAATRAQLRGGAATTAMTAVDSDHAAAQAAVNGGVR